MSNDNKIDSEQKKVWDEACPECKAAEFSILLITKWIKNTKYSECTKCGHTWNKTVAIDP